MESRGQRAANTSEPVLLRAAIEGKRLVNFHVTELWAHGLKDALLISVCAAWCGLDELRAGFPWLPEWVWRNLWRQTMAGHGFECLHPFDEMDAKVFGIEGATHTV